MERIFYRMLAFVTLSLLLLGAATSAHAQLTAVDDPSSGDEARYTVKNGDRGIVINGRGVLDNDVYDTTHNVSAMLVTNVDYGSLSFGPNGSINYGVPPNDQGNPQQSQTTFTYKLYDATTGAFSNVATVTIFLSGSGSPNDPSAYDDAFTVDEDSAPNTLDLFADNGSGADATDANTEAFFIDSVTQPANGTVVITSAATGEVTYEPDPDFSGVDTFTYTIEDAGGQTSTATVTVTVDNKPPVVDATADQFTSEGGVVSLTINADDPDDPDSGLTLTVTGLPSGLTATDNGDGTVTISGIVDAGEAAGSPFTVTVTAEDGDGETGSTSFDFFVSTFIVRLLDTSSTVVGDFLTIEAAYDAAVIDDVANSNGPYTILVSDDTVEDGFSIVLPGLTITHASSPTATLTGNIRVNADDVTIDGLGFKAGTATLNNLIYVGQSTGVTGVTLIDNTFEMSGQTVTATAVRVGNGTDPTSAAVVGNAFSVGSSLGARGLFLQTASSSVDVIGNTFTDIASGTDGARAVISRSSDLVLAENTIVSVIGTTAFGFFLDAGTTVSNGANVITTNATNGVGIRMDDATFVTLANDVISGNDIGVLYTGDDADLVTLRGNDLSGNTLAVDNADGDDTLDASGNWWGAVDLLSVASASTGDVDFAPWLADGTDTDGGTTGFQGDFSLLLTADLAASPQANGTAGNLEEAVHMADAGGAVVANNGTYAEGNFDIGSDGATTLTSLNGDAVTAIGVGGAAASANLGLGIIADDVTLGGVGHGFTIAPTAVTARQALRIGRDSTGTAPAAALANVLVQGNTLGSFVSTGHAYGAYVTNVDGTALLGNTLADISGTSVGFGLFVEGGTHGANALTVDGNVIEDISGTAEAVGMRFLDATNVTLHNNVMDTGFSAPANAFGLIFAGTVSDVSNENNVIGGVSYGVHFNTGGTYTNVKLSGDEIYGTSKAAVYVKAGPVNLSIVGNHIHDNTGNGIEVEAAADASEVSVQYNQFAGNTGFSVTNENSGEVLDARYNYWGDTDGPSSPGLDDVDPVTAELADNAAGQSLRSDDEASVRFDPWTTSLLDVSIASHFGLDGTSKAVSVRVDETGGDDDVSDKGIIAFQFRVVFDPSILQVDASDPINLVGMTSAFMTGANASTSVDNMGGTLDVFFAASTALVGEGTLVEVNFDVVGTGTSALDLQSFLFNQGSPQASLTDGTFTAVAAATALGNANLDGAIDAADAAEILANLPGASPNCDVSGDSSCTAYDAALVLQYSAGLIACFPAQAGCVSPSPVPFGALAFSVAHDGDVVTLPVSVSGRHVTSAQFTLAFDTADYVLADVANLLPADWMIEYGMVEGGLHVAMAGTTPVDAGQLAELRLRKLGTAASTLHATGFVGETAAQTKTLDTAAPDAFGLEAGYPNPFSGTTTVGYTLAQTADVKLVVYNTLGQVVRVLVDAPQEAGAFTASWDGKNAAGHAVAAGMYLYRLEAGDHTAIQKVMYIK